MPQNEERYVSLAEVKSILKKVQKEREEMIYEQKTALKHAETFAKLPVTKVKKLVKELLENVGMIEERHAYKIADLLPTHEDDIKTLFAKERIHLKEGDVKKILEIVQNYIKG
ncbi:MAG: RNA polymerase [Thermoplasmata archaeon]|nr:RNA polymerase [Thermoplasmata archaeon]RLF26702.1 MAG: RNA polymerase [Thermoplasmata archaeon]